MYALSHVSAIYRTNFAWPDAVRACDSLRPHRHHPAHHFCDPCGILGKDLDHDGICDIVELSPQALRFGRADFDADGLPDERDLDDDNDGDPDVTDPAPRNVRVSSRRPDTGAPHAECIRGHECRHPYCRSPHCRKLTGIAFVEPEQRSRVDLFL